MKLLRALKLGAQEWGNSLEDTITQKVRMTMEKYYQDVLRQDDIVKIGLVIEYVTQPSKFRGEDVPTVQ